MTMPDTHNVHPTNRKPALSLLTVMQNIVAYSRVLFTMELYCTQNSIHNC
jgi:hypothetical protein